MFVRRKRVRSGQGTLTYVQLVENYRRDGKVRQKVLLTVGREDQLPPGRVDEIVGALKDWTERAVVLESVEELSLASGRSFGGVHVLERLWDELALDRILARLLKRRAYTSDVTAAIRAMVFNRCLDPHSKLGTLEWAQGDAWLPDTEGMGPQNLYRALDFLVEHKETVEKALYAHMTDLFCLDVSLVFYDTTLVNVSSEPEADEERQLVQYSRKKTSQFLLALALSRDGLPFAHEVLPGNTTDVVTVKTAIDKLRRQFGVRQVMFVGDRGTVSEENLKWLRSQDVHYIVGAPMRRTKEVRDSVLGTAGRYQQLEENLHVKEVEVEGRRYVICLNPEEAVRDLKTRESIVAYLEEALKDPPGPGTKEAAALFCHPVYGRYLCRLPDGTLKLDRTRLKAEARYDGKYVLHTSHPELTREEVARAYRQLMMVERSFRSLKSLEELAPVYHWKDRRIKGHVFVCVLAHLLERVMERRLAQGGVQGLTASRALRILSRVQLVPVQIRDHRWLVRTDLSPDAAAIFNALHYRVPPKIQPLPQLHGGSGANF